MKKSFALLASILLLHTLQAQKEPSVENTVDLKKYAGTWYEIARLPNVFERKLKCISATYTLRDDGKITVMNKGTRIDDPSRTSSTEGVAWAPDKNHSGKLKVQFFWPFSADYWILYLDKEYRYAVVGDPDKKYLWILARAKRIDEAAYELLLGKAIDNGYDVTPVIKVDHDCDPLPNSGR